MSMRQADLMPSDAMAMSARHAGDVLPVSPFDPAGTPAAPVSDRHGSARPAPLAQAAAEQPPGFAARQTILSVVVEVEPKSTAKLRALLERLRQDVEAMTPKYRNLKHAVPTLHFISMTVFGDAHHDPILVIEANFDGPPGPFWARLEAAIGPRLRDMLRCCKPPRDKTRGMFDGIVAAGARLPVAPYLEARTVRPAVGHQGNRGLSRPRIEAEAALFGAVQKEL